MTPDEVLKVADEAVLQTGKKLSDLHRTILRELCEGKKYGEVQSHHSYGHIKDAASELWRLLSEALGERVTKSNFQGALEKRLKLGDIVPKPPMPSSYNQQTWVGRESLISDLLPKLQRQTRLLWITGISGIGKTTMGECLAVKAWEIDPTFQWIYLKVLEGQSPDFPSVAADLLAKLGDRDLDPQERNNPDQLARRLLQKLQSYPYWIQLDALERLLKPEYSTEFVDPYWATFLQRCLTEPAFTSRLVLTSQAFPNALVEWNDRYSNVWTEIRLDGLLQVEQQLEFFAKRGIAVDAANHDILVRIAKIYEGHPLVLKVIAEDILKDFAGNVVRYWQVYQPEFEQVARELQTARLDETAYNEALDRKVRDRIKKSLEQLPTDALDLLCRSSVFRRPVPKTFWLAMIGDRSSKRQKDAYRTLDDRALVEKEGIHQNQHLIRQHNLIRDIAYDLLRQSSATWETAERQAAELWLTVYQPAPDVPNLEKVRGYLEAFDHYCEVKDWQRSMEIVIEQGIGPLLEIWGYYKEMGLLYAQLLDRLDDSTNVICLKGLGNASISLSNYQEGLKFYKQSLEIACRINDHEEEGNLLNNLGIIYKNLGKFHTAIECYRKSLIISRKTKNREEEARNLNNLGNAFLSLNKHNQAIKYYKQSLTIANELNDIRGMSLTLGNLGVVYHSISDFEQSINYQSQHLAISREIGDRQGEGRALGRLGSIYTSLGHYSKAVEYLNNGLLVLHEIGDRTAETQTYKSLAELYQKTGPIDLAKQYCDRALALAIELGIPLAEECRSLQAELNKEVNNGESRKD